jgi:hypothetical protein
MANLDARWETVKDESSGFLLKECEKGGEFPYVFLFGMDSGGRWDPRTPSSTTDSNRCI